MECKYVAVHSCCLLIISRRFRWVFCQLEILSQSFPSSVRRILKELPESLDQTYERILKEIRKANQKHAYRLLQCLVAAIRPLHLHELAEVLAVDFEAGGTHMLDPSLRHEAVLSACSGLVTIIEDGDSQVVQFSHFTVKEFLSSNRLAESSKDVSRYHIHLEAAHTILAQACLGVLLQLDDNVDRNSIGSFPLARYASRYWVKHAQFGKVSSRIEEGMDSLFDSDKPYFSAWLWIYNEDNPHHCLSSPRPSKPEAVPLYYAALHGFRDLVERLLAKHPEDVHARGGRWQTPLQASVEGQYVDIFLQLTDHSPDVHGWRGLTALHLASQRRLLEIGQRLLHRGADVNARSVDGWTPLYIAAKSGQLELARILLEYYPLVDIPDKDGRSPLHVAGMEGHVEIVRLLLVHGADPNLRDWFGKTISDRILGDKDKEDIMELLSEYDTKSVEEQSLSDNSDYVTASEESHL